MAIDDKAANKARADRARRSRIWERHARAAIDGIHLPSTRELILGMGWMGGELETDAKAWSERVARRIVDNEAGKRVRAELGALTAGGRLDAACFIAVADAIESATNIKAMSALAGADYEQNRLRGIDVGAATDRLFVYAALADGGDKDCCLRVAQDAVRYARDHDTGSVEVSLFVQAALGFISLSLDSFRTWRGGRGRDARNGVTVTGNELFTLAMLDQLSSEQPPPDTSSTSDTPVGLRDILDGITLGGADRAEQGTDTARAEPDGLVVIKEIGNPGTGEGKRVAETFKPITGAKLPLAPVKNLALVRELLTEEFPYARRVIDSIINPLEGRKHIHLKPLVLVGEPGSGKTTFALRLLQRLNIPSTIYGCGGISDASAAGTARQWQTGGPSIIISAILRHRTASVGIVLDEIDRVANNRQNGNLQDALLAMLEPTSAKRWYDPYVMAEVDVSATIFLATSNSTDIPAALRDRMRIIRWPNPGPEHLETLAIDLRDAILEERGLPMDWALPFTGSELEALREAWPGGSLRALRRLVEKVLDIRDHIGDEPVS